MPVSPRCTRPLRRRHRFLSLILPAALEGLCQPEWAQDADALAKNMSIPVAAPISVPWCAGRNFMLLKQDKSWTVGALVNHISDIAGSGSRRRDISNAFVQPFLANACAGGCTLAFNIESAYD